MHIELDWAVYPTPETTTTFPSELRLEFYGIQSGKWVPSGIQPDERKEFITLKDPSGNILPIKACYTNIEAQGRVGVTINLIKEYTEIGKYSVEIKDGIYMNRVSESAPYVPSPGISLEYEVGGTWIPTNDLSAINPSKFMDIGYDSYAVSGIPYITKDGETVAKCTDYKGAYPSDMVRYLFFDNDLFTPGMYEVVIPAQSICWDQGNEVCSNEYFEQKFKLISPMNNLITWPAKAAKVINPKFILIVMPDLVDFIHEFKRNTNFEVYKDGKFVGTRKPTTSWYGDYDLGFTISFEDLGPGSYKITIPSSCIEIGEFKKPLPENVVLEFEIVTEQGADIENIMYPDETNGKIEVYDLTGKKVTGNPAPGIYIVRSQSAVKKIVVR